MAISEYRKIQIEQRKLEENLDKITTQKAQYYYAKTQLLKGSSSRIALLSLQESVQIEKKYAEIYGENWRETLTSETVSQIEEKIRVEKRDALRQIEDRILKTKLCGRSLSKRRW